MESTKARVLKVLEKVKDPEIGINIVDMGLIYGVEIDDKIHVKMTLTTPHCPLGSMIVSMAEQELKKAFSKDVEIELVFDPPWTPDRMSEDIKKQFM